MSESIKPENTPFETYEELLRYDGNTVPEYLKQRPIRDVGVDPISADRYYSQDFFDKENKHLWTRVWQMVCHEDDIPNVGDCFLYEIADNSLIIVRTEDGVKAYFNSCLHRGRKLITGNCKKKEFVCPFHAFTWDLDGNLVYNPMEWDFPQWNAENTRLPQAKVALWGGFVFINMDQDAQPFEIVAAPMIADFEHLDYANRYRQFWVEKHLRTNWKVLAEAFMESHHSQTTHPQILPTLADLNSQYDVFSNYVSRQISAGASHSPSVKDPLNEHEKIAYMAERGDRRTLGVDLSDLPDDFRARPFLAARAREALSERLNKDCSHIPDAEILDAILYGLFPNMTFWAGQANNLVYRWRPEPGNPEGAIMDIMMLLPLAEGQDRPANVKPIVLGYDEKMSDLDIGVPALTAVFDQDFGNLPHVQSGLKASGTGTVHFADYSEVRLRLLHQMIDKMIETGEAGSPPPSP